MTETVAAESKLQEFWTSLITHEHPERPWLFHRQGKKVMQYSYKDIHAQAHCIAAYLLNCGLEKGEPVAILANEGPFSLTVDLALQYMGAVNVFFPVDVADAVLFGWMQRSGCRHIFVESQDTFLRLQQFRPVKDQLQWIFLQTDDVESLDTEKIATFDFLIMQGKAVWREITQPVRERKASVTLRDTYALVYEHQSGRDFTPVTFGQMLEETHRACEEMGPVKQGPWVECVGSVRLMQRTFGCFAAMRLGVHVYTLPFEAVDGEFLQQTMPTALIITPAQHQQLYESLLFALLPGDAGRRAVDHALKICEKREAFLIQGKKPPLLLRWRYNRLKNGFFSRLRKKMGGRLSLLLLDRGTIHTTSERYWGYMGLIQRQIS